MLCRVFFALLLHLLSCAVALPQISEGEVDPYYLTAWGFDSQVRDIALQADGKVIAVGLFSQAVGASSRGILRLNPNGTVDTSFRTGPGANNGIYRVIVLPDGKILLSGLFTTFGGQPANRIVRLNSNGTIDPTFNTNGGASSGAVHTMAIQPDGKIVVAGNFSAFGGAPANQIARLHPDGSLDTSFIGSPSIGTSGPILSVAFQADGKIVIGGNFQMPNLARGIARLMSDGSWDTAFSSSVSGSGLNAVKVIDDKILIGGGFGYGRLLSTGAADPSFTGGTLPATAFVQQPDGKIIIAASGSASGSLRRIEANGGADPSFVANETQTINSVALHPTGTIFIGGLFDMEPNSGSANPAGVRRLNSNGSRDTSFVTRHGAAEFYVQKFAALPNGKIVLRGEFSSIGNLPLQKFAMLNPDGSVDHTFAPPEYGYTAMAATPDNKIIVAGNRFTPNGTYPIRRLNQDGTIDPTFTAQSTTDNARPSNIEDLAVQPDGKVLVAGDFSSINGVPRRGIVRLMPDGSIDNTFTPNVITPQMSAVNIEKILVQPDGKVWIAGLFTNIGRTQAVFRLNAQGTAETFTQVFYQFVTENVFSSMDQQPDGKILLAGFFSTIATHSTKFVGRLNLDGSVDTSFTAPTVAGVTSANYLTSIVPLKSGRLLVGGDFSTIGGIARSGLARLNPDGSVDTSYTVAVTGANFPNVGVLLRERNGNILVGGNFKQIGGVSRWYHSRLLQTRTGPVFDFDGDGKTDIGIFRPSVAEWWIQRSGDGNVLATRFGAATDHIVPADYTGDGKSDVAVWRPATGEWFVLRSDDFTYYSFPFGASGDVPATADYDADGKADATVFRPSTATWYVFRSSGGTTIETFGANGDIPVPADYDGDGKADLAIFRPSVGQWWLNRSTTGLIATTFGDAGVKPVQGDYTGDGKADVAFWRPSTGDWFVLRSEDFSFFSFPFGTTGDTPAPGDYDGDGKFDATVFRSSNATWYSQRTTAGTLIQQFGQTGDRPIPNAFVP